MLKWQELYEPDSAVLSLESQSRWEAEAVKSQAVAHAAAHRASQTIDQLGLRVDGSHSINNAGGVSVQATHASFTAFS